jgi:hypothetical protein
VRNLASLPVAPTVFFYMLTVVMMPLFKWWLTCFWGLYLYYYYYPFCELVWTWLMAIFFTSTRKWALAMLFSTGINLGFTCLGMRLVNKCLGSKMLYTRSKTTMNMHLEISMPMLKQQLPPINWFQLIVVKASPSGW